MRFKRKSHLTLHKVKSGHTKNKKHGSSIDKFADNECTNRQVIANECRLVKTPNKPPVLLKTPLTPLTGKNLCRVIVNPDPSSNKCIKRKLMKTPRKLPTKSYKVSPANKKMKSNFFSSKQLFSDLEKPGPSPRKYVKHKIVKTPQKTRTISCKASPASMKNKSNFSSSKTLFSDIDINGSQFKPLIFDDDNDTDFVSIETDTASETGEMNQDCISEMPYVENDKQTDEDTFEYTFVATPLETSEAANAIKYKHSGNESVGNENELLLELQELLPDVVKALEINGQLDYSLLSFFRQVKENRFPLNNIAFRLWLEVVRWYDTTTTTTMRYSNETKMFWKLGWRMFGERFLNFMGGYKSHGTVTKSEEARGLYSPSNSELNFAVPNHSILRTLDIYEVGGERLPGIYEDVMDFLSNNLSHQSACLTFDGKKLKMGLSGDIGDVDLLGHEPDITLKQKKEDLLKFTNEVTAAENSMYDLADATSISPIKEKVYDLLRSTLRKISLDIFTTKDTRRKKEYTKMKLIEKGGEKDWRKGRYHYAISGLIAFIIDIDDYIEEATTVNEKICAALASLNECQYVSGKIVNLRESPKYIDIEEQLKYNDGQQGSPRFVKQRSESWFGMRQKAKITGSTLHRAIGGEGIGKMKDHFENVMCGVAEKDPTPETKILLEHGVKNELNAVSTVVGKIMPALEPGLKFCEEGCVPVETHDGIVMVVSPDGSLREDASLNKTRVAIEIKCPYYKLHTKFPARYLLQCLSQIEALEVSYLLFVSWTKEESAVFKVERDQPVFQQAVKIALSIYAENSKKPTKLNDDQKNLMNEIQRKSDSIEFIGRFSSTVSSDQKHTYVDPVVSVNDIQSILDEIKEVAKKSFELRRERASEAVVFLVSDLDRSWMKDKIKWSPVSWFPKGYSLTTNVMRSIAENILDKCNEKGIHIPCASFDGQWHGIMTRSREGEPLTRLQMQKDTWKKVVDISRPHLVAEITKLNKKVSWNVIDVVERDEEGQEIGRKRVIEARYEKKCPVFRKISKPIDNNNLEKAPQQKSRITPSQESTPSLADAVPTFVMETGSTSEEVLTMVAAEDEELEVFSCNINEDKWADKLFETRNDENNNELQIESEIVQTASELDPKQYTQKTRNLPLETLALNEDDASCFLALFKTTKDCNRNGKWNNTTPGELLNYFTSSDNIKKMLDVELRLVIRYLKKRKNLKLKESVTKAEKINVICRLLKIEPARVTAATNPRIQKSGPTMKSLAELAASVVSNAKKISKPELNVWYAEYIWPDEYKIWYRDVENMKLNGTPYTWFYKPEYSKVRKQYETRCVDSSHLLTRARQKCCKTGLNGFTNEPWKKVAVGKKTLLTKIMVEQCTDPMSVPMAVTHFSADVEQGMRGNNDTDCADLVHDIRNWWEAEDNPGIPANNRIQMRSALRERLIGLIDWNRFPPVTVSVHGWPLQLWEALICNIDAKVILYGLCHNNSYHDRTFSSMLGETYFSELVLNDKRGVGTVSCKEFSQFVGCTIENVQARLDTNRGFAYRTARNHVYNLVDESIEIQENRRNCTICNNGVNCLPRDIVPVNHEFDSIERGRRMGRKKMETVATSRTALQRGSLGVRWEKARRNEAKMLPSDKMGVT